MPTAQLLRLGVLNQSWRMHQFRWLHQPEKPPPLDEQQPQRPALRQDLSLFDELFPEETKKTTSVREVVKIKEHHVPRLPLLDLDEMDKRHRESKTEPNRVTRAASLDAFRQDNVTVLVLSNASKSLVESDFRYIVPQGQHIGEWRGPGDIMKVIPGRDPNTLQQLAHYFLIFPNPAYARAYQNHALTLHRMAKTHTPTSIESSLAPPKGMVIRGRDVFTLLQNYSLVPPSQNISLVVRSPPFSTSIRNLLTHGGYAPLTGAYEKTGKAILFWVDGYQPSTSMVRSAISKNERIRGMTWAMAPGEASLKKIDTPLQTMDDSEESEVTEAAEDFETKHLQRSLSKWIITFANEAEARRFTRAWHRKSFPLPGDTGAYGEPHPLVHAEFMW